MKHLVAVAALVAVVNLVAAQEKVPEDHAQAIARLLVKHSADVKAPMKIEVEEDKPYALKDGDYGALVLPAKKLSAEVIDKAGKDVVPIAQFWMKQLTPIASGKALANDKLQLVKVKTDDQELQVTMYWIGVRKGDKGLEAVIYAKDKEPILVAPLEKADSKQTNPIEFEAKKGDYIATLIFTCSGKYRFAFDITLQQD